MPPPVSIKATHKAILKYYETLSAYSGQHVGHELALRSAFQNLLAETARSHNWILIPELGAKVAGRTVRPDGTLRDQNSLPRGYWEAKDSADDLDAAIRKKTDRGYPSRTRSSRTLKKRSCSRTSAKYRESAVQFSDELIEQSGRGSIVPRAFRKLSVDPEPPFLKRNPMFPILPLRVAVAKFLKRKRLEPRRQSQLS